MRGFKPWENWFSSMGRLNPPAVSSMHRPYGHFVFRLDSQQCIQSTGVGTLPEGWIGQPLDTIFGPPETLNAILKPLPTPEPMTMLTLKGKGSDEDIGFARLMPLGQEQFLAACFSTTVELRLGEIIPDFLEQKQLGVAFADLNGYLLDANPSLLQLVGYSLAEIQTRHVRDMLHPDDVERDLAMMQEILQGQRDFYQLKERLITAQGDPLWVEVRVSALRDTAGNPYQLLALVTDISEKEMQIRQNQQQLEAVVSSLDDIVFLFDAEGTFLNCWTRREDALFLPREQFIGKRLTEVLPPDFAAMIQEKIDAALATGKAQALTYPSPVDQRWFQALFFKQKQGNLVTATIKDMTEAHRLEQAREREYQLLNQLYDLSLNAELSIDDKIQRLLAIGLDTFGLDLALVARIRDHEYRVTYSHARQGTALEVGSIYDVRETYCAQILKDNAAFVSGRVGERQLKDDPCYEAFALEAYIGTPLYVNGELYGSLSFSSLQSIDLGTEDLRLMPYFANVLNHCLVQVQNRKKLEFARDKAEKAEMAKSQFLATMSHEIRTPMSGILSVIELLKYTSLDAKQTELIDMIETSSEHLLAILNDVLDYSKIEAGKFTLKPSLVSIHQLIQNVKQLFQPMAEAKNLELTVLQDPLPGHFVLDPIRLSQVLNNLVSNGIKFTQQGGITIHLQGERLAEQRWRLTFRIQDTGQGISHQMQSQLFKPFAQRDTEFQTRGTGLGLAISKELVELMGGSLTCSSIPGQGSVFTLVLEAESQEPMPETPVESEKTVSNHPYQLAPHEILLAEDNLLNRKLALRIFEKLGFSPHGVEDGQMVLEALAPEPERYKLIVLDMNMPRLDGLDTAREIRKRYGQQHTIIAMTANAMHESRKACLDAGMNDFISKPFKMDDVRQFLEQYFKVDRQTELHSRA